MADSLGGAFWRFWGAAALANVGDGIRLAAFPLLAAALTDEPLGVAVVVGAQSLPWLVTGLAAGALADRRPSRLLVAAADVARLVLLGGLAAAVALGWATVALVAVCAFALGVGETVRDTAAQAAVPRLVPSALLERANGRLVAAEVVGNEFVGPPVGAALFVVGAALPFAANGASLALAVMLVLSLPLTLPTGRGPASREEAGPPVGAGVRAGLAWLARHRTMRTLSGVVAAVAAADSAWFAIFVLYVRERLGLGAVGFGALLAVGAAGGLVGAFLADRVVAGRRHRAVLGWSVAVTAGIPLALVASPTPAAAALVVVVTSGSFALLNVTAVSLRHRLVPDGLVGRVTAAQRTLSFGSAAAGTLLGGALASSAGLEAPFVFCGLVAVLATVWWVGASRPAPGPA